MKYTIKNFKAQFPDDAACLRFLFVTRYGKNGPVCECGKSKCFYPRSGRKTYACSWCGHEVSPTVDTIFHKSPTPLLSWFHAIFLFSTAKNGVAAKEIERQIGVTYKCAWRIARQIRLLYFFLRVGSVPSSSTCMMVVPSFLWTRRVIT